MKRIAASFFTVLVACAGEGETTPRDGSPYSVRDSAGIEIVESVRPRWSESERWRLSSEPLFTIHATDGSDPTLLLDPTSIDVDPRGRIIIADGDQVGWEAILVYDSLGRFELKAGGPGEGPGEYGQLWWASAYRGDSIVGYDMGTRRANVFDPAGRYVRQVRVPSLVEARPPAGTYSYVDGMDHAYGDGHFLAYPMGLLDIGEGPGPAWYRHLLLRLSPEGESWDTLGTFEIYQQHWDGERASQYWFGAIAVTAVGPTALYFGRGDSFEIGRYEAEGRLTRIIRRAHEPEPVTEEMKARLLEWRLEALRSSPFGTPDRIEQARRDLETAVYPGAIPPYASALLDEDGNLWVEKYTRYPGIEGAPGSGPVPWSVFDSSGVWLGDVEVPEGFVMREVTRNRAFGFRVDAFGVKEVDVYGLVRPRG